MGTKAVPGIDLIKPHLRLVSAQEGKEPSLTLKPALLGTGVSVTFPEKKEKTKTYTKEQRHHVALEMLGEITAIFICHVAQPLQTTFSSASRMLSLGP